MVLGSAFAQKDWTEIGKIVNGKPVLFINKEEALKNYNRNIQNIAGINDKFTDIKIVKHDDASYSLVFVGQTHVSAFFVKNTGRNTLSALASTTCTTTECSQEAKGCIPKSGGGCTPCSNGGTCTKSSSDTAFF